MGLPEGIHHPMSTVDVACRCRPSMSTVDVACRCRPSMSTVDVDRRCRPSMSPVDVACRCRQQARIRAHARARIRAHARAREHLAYRSSPSCPARRFPETLLRPMTPSSTQGERVPPLPALEPGGSIKHYEIIRKLGQGGMGAVFLA